MSTEHEPTTPAAVPESPSPSAPAPGVDVPRTEESSPETTSAAEQSAASTEGSTASTGDAAATDGSGEAKKRRRRRRKKKPAGAEGSEGADASADGSAEDEGDDEGPEDAEAEGEAKEGEAKEAGARPDRPRRPKGPRPDHGPQRDKPPFSNGEEVVGRITKVMDHAIMIDVSGKALGIFDRAELPESEVLTEGERFIAKIGNDGARGGLVVLTHDLNRWQKSRIEVEAAVAEKKPVFGLVTGVIKGGVEVDVGGLRGFAPASHVEVRPGAELHHLLGQRLEFEVVQYAKKGKEFVLSRRAVIEAEANEKRKEQLDKLVVGSIVNGTVRTITPFGVFVDVGGIDGLVHLTEVSHTAQPIHELFKPGEQVDVKILKVDEKGKVWLSRRAVERDPWEGMAEKYARGTRHKGKVVRLAAFGVFIELEAGVDGLMHASDIVAPKRFDHPSEVYKVGQELEVLVAQNDISNRKIGLHPAPKDGEVSSSARLTQHQSVKCVVEGHEATGIMVRIIGQTGRWAKGWVPAAATGTPRGTDLRRVFPLNKELDAKIIELDPRKGAKLSVRALEQDQERASYKAYQTEVKQASKFGTFGDLLKNKLAK